MIQDPTKYAAVFQMNIGAGGAADSDFDMPQNSVSEFQATCVRNRFRLHQVSIAQVVAAAGHKLLIWRNTTAIATSKRPKSRAATDSEMYTAYVPNKSPLACETKLQGILASEDHYDSGMFWGVEYYNDMLLQEGEVGNVQSEMLLHEDEGIFSFREGWVFPMRILFNGDECVMPPPDDYPRLPKNTARAA
ncbi:hypothetical protein Goshw_015779, partial [Gossypium schwendimanii]|nr:hypothetical protein [Gossypium schwendimanii]